MFYLKQIFILPEAELACKDEADGHTYYVMSAWNTQIRKNLIKFYANKILSSHSLYSFSNKIPCQKIYKFLNLCYNKPKLIE